MKREDLVKQNYEELEDFAQLINELKALDILDGFGLALLYKIGSLEEQQNVVEKYRWEVADLVTPDGIKDESQFDAETMIGE